MLWPALRVLARGELTADQLQELHSVLDLAPVARTEGPGARASIAHRTRTVAGGRLVTDLARAGDDGWVLALFFDGQAPDADVIAEYRTQWRGLVDQLDLELVEITPAAAADEVLVLPDQVDTDEAVDAWELPYDQLDQMWPHVGLRSDAPREVKKVKLRELMRTPAWRVAPAPLRHQAEEFLADA
ncbi:hypothetical protein [Streptomyces sp. NPDC056982]|uniref:hypothetical protein n=1 Tax=Streptomyces sp. NPDC056982 TaxID=3345986 RepID=UPI00363BFFF1